MRRERPLRYVLPCVGKGLQVGVVVGCVLLGLVAYYAPMAGLLAFVLWPVVVAMGGLCGALWGLCREVAAVPNRRTRLALQLGLAGLAIMLVAWQSGWLRGLLRPGTGTEPTLDRPRRVVPPGRRAAERQRDHAAAQGFPVRVVNTMGMEFRLVLPGELRGESGADAERQGEAAGGANRPTRIDRPLYVGVHEITRGQWAAVMGTGPGHVGDPGGEWVHRQMPVDHVSWDDCRVFIQRLSAMEGVPAGTYRLLTEAEWEYACRAGMRSPFNGKWTSVRSAGVGFRLAREPAVSNMGLFEDAE